MAATLAAGVRRWPGQLDGPLVDVDRPHRGAGAPAGQGAARSARSRSPGRAGRRPAGGAGRRPQQVPRCPGRPPRRRTRRGPTPGRGVRSGSASRHGAGPRRRPPGRGRSSGRRDARPPPRPTLALMAMAPYTIRLFGDPVLKQRRRRGHRHRRRPRPPGRRHVRHACTTPTAPGLAAPQVGVQKRLFVYDIDDEPDRDHQPGHHRDPRRVELRRGLPVDPGPAAARSCGPRRSTSPGYDLDGNEIAIEADELEARVLPARARPPRRGAAARAPRQGPAQGSQAGAARDGPRAVPEAEAPRLGLGSALTAPPDALAPPARLPRHARDGRRAAAGAARRRPRRSRWWSAGPTTGGAAARACRRAR